jgi:ABC-2 type transport system permease protein
LGSKTRQGPRFWFWYSTISCVQKYLIILRQSLSQSITYRLQIVFQILQSFITPLLLISVLSFAKASQGIEVSSLIPYYLLVSLTYPLVISGIDEEMEALSVSGDINNFLIKPLPLFRYLLTKNLGEKLSIAIPVLPILSMTLFLGNEFSFWAVAVSLPMSFILSFCFSYLTGLLCFWVDEFWAIHNVKFVLIKLLGGVAVPLSFFPQGLTEFLQYTPFPYLVSWVARISQNNFRSIEFIIAISWILFLYLLCNIVEKITIKKYSFTAT